MNLVELLSLSLSSSSDNENFTALLDSELELAVATDRPPSATPPPHPPVATTTRIWR
jgi:hypothetical protein